MNYCVIKDTIRVINSNNLVEIMMNDAVKSGFSENEVEILTEEEYQARKALEPVSPQPPSTEERLKTAEDTILFLLTGGM